MKNSGSPVVFLTQMFSGQAGRRKVAICHRGVLSGIVLRGRESLPQGEGPDGNTQAAKETYAGHVGPDKRKQTSLRRIATGSCNG